MNEKQQSQQYILKDLRKSTSKMHFSVYFFLVLLSVEFALSVKPLNVFLLKPMNNGSLVIFVLMIILFFILFFSLLILLLKTLFVGCKKDYIKNQLSNKFNEEQYIECEIKDAIELRNIKAYNMKFIKILFIAQFFSLIIIYIIAVSSF